MQHNVSTLILLADVQLQGTLNLDDAGASFSPPIGSPSFHTIEKATTTLKSAYDVQKSVVNHSRSKLGTGGGENSLVVLEKSILSDLCRRIAMTMRHGTKDGDVTPHEECDLLLQEALSLDARNTKAMISFASLAKDRGDSSKCASLCEKVIRASSSLSEQAEASILLSDVMFAQSSTQNGVEGLDDIKTLSSKRQSNNDDDDIQEFKGEFSFAFLHQPVFYLLTYLLLSSLSFYIYTLIFPVLINQALTTKRNKELVIQLAEIYQAESMLT